MSTYRRPKELGKVVRSVNEPFGPLCLDVFQRPDGTYSYEEYRRDPETCEGWFPVGFHSETRFSTLQDALDDAEQKVAWFTASPVCR